MAGAATPPGPAPDPLALPTVTLPKGGGAVRGIDEKLTVALATGGASLSIPIPASPGRQGFGPSLSLTYGSGTGNGPFGMGWDLTVPSVTRKTSIGLPRYEDAEDSDVFVLSETEDLVPSLVADGDSWVPEPGTDPTGLCTVRRYRPRVEAAFARVERWTTIATGDVHWRAVSAANVTSLFGRTPASRIADPADPSRVFSWLLDGSYDDRGNAMTVEYKAEDAVNVVPAAHEQGRVVTANRYPKRILYGNVTPFDPTTDPDDPTAWLFEVVFDFGEHPLVDPTPVEATTWPCRPDPFSTYRSCFEVRTYRLCRRALVFHRFPDGLDVSAVLVRSLDLTYAAGATGDPTVPLYSVLTSATQTGYAPDGTGGTTTLSSPPLTLGYSPVAVHDTVAVAGDDAVANLPAGVDGSGWRWCDLDGEGIQGVLTEDDAAWYYTRNISAWAPDDAPLVAAFEPMDVVASKPSGTASARSPQLVDLHGNGRLCAVDLAAPVPGYFERDDEGDWLPFMPLPTTVGLDVTDPNFRLVDLDGDGLADALFTEDGAFTWYPWLAADGFGPGERVTTPTDEDAGPALVLAEGDRSIYLADMSGDGLADLVRIRNGDVCYWPNVGFGRFGAKVVMDAAPWFDAPDLFDARRVQLADIDGAGTADLVYVGTGGAAVWFNQSGNSYTAPTPLASFPGTDDLSAVAAVDLLGTGTTCLAWSSSLPGDGGRQLRYVDLMGGVKPLLLTSIVNNMGAETTLTYAASTRFSVEDLLAGHPWATRLAFPVHVVAQKQVVDRVSGTELVSSYSYHHGYFDPTEREFRGFARVDQIDTDSVPADSGIGGFTSTPATVGGEFTLPPVLTRTWVHTGAYFGSGDIAAVLAGEYFSGDPDAAVLGATLFVDAVTPEEQREACRALRGRVLRTEITSPDGSPEATVPYSVTGHRYQVRLVQPPSGPSYGSVYASELESLASHYERDATDPRTTHELALEVDPYGAVTKSASAAYPRRVPVFPEQGATLLTYTEHDVTNVDDEVGWYRVGVPVETRSYELTGIVPTGLSGLFDTSALLGQAPTVPEIPTGTTASGSNPQKRLIGRSRTVYRADDLSGPLPTGQVDSLAIVDRSYQLSLTPDVVASAFSGPTTAATATAEATTSGGYTDLDGDGSWWAGSASVFYEPVATFPTPPAPDPGYAAEHFYLPQGHVDPYGGVTAISWEHDIAVVSSTDPVGNTTAAEVNYRVLQPWLLTDANDNRSGARYDPLGRVVAVAMMGKVLSGGGDEGDHLDLTTDEPSASDDPTATFDYGLDAYSTWAANPSHDPNEPQPVYSHTRERVRHQDPTTPWLETYRYVDGLGREALKKVQAEPGLAPVVAGDGTVTFETTDTRWVGSGKVIYDNKANPVKSYEPFFDIDQSFTVEPSLVERGVTAITRYDPLGRIVRVDNPDGSCTTTAFTPWQTQASDENDTASTSVWYSDRASGGLGADQQDAAAKALACADTPLVTDLDPLGRTFHSVADGPGGQIQTRLHLDILGHELTTVDALGRTVLRTTYDLGGTPVQTVSSDAGERWLLHDSGGRPLSTWDSRGYLVRITYDAARRPLGTYVTAGAAAEVLAESVVYGEGQPNDVADNLRGTAFEHRDGAGVATTVRCDFDGNVVASSRQLLDRADVEVDWSAAAVLSAEVFATSTTYDALHRIVTATTPDGSVTTPVYNERSLLAGMTLALRGGAAVSYVDSVVYDAKGQRQTIDYGNGAVTNYTYDPDTFRLVHLVTTRPGTGSPVQDLTYTYDPVGNVTRIEDAAQSTVFFANQLVAPVGDFTYDVTYRLTRATGREHVAQGSTAPTTWDDSAQMAVPLPTDTQAMRNFTETYAYDLVGNLTAVGHAAAGGSWTRTYVYDGGVVPPTTSRLTTTQVGATTEPYTYDANGNTTSMPQLTAMGWDFADRLESSARQVVNAGMPETTWYRYDVGAKRVRKSTLDQSGATVAERFYLGGYEVYREYTGAVTTLERQTLVLPDAGAFLAIVETTTVDTSGATTTPSSAVRYQFANHLGSACVELDETAAVISYEEYYPYGATSFQAGRSAAEVSLKRYRYTGQERDSESGLDYHAARYYAPWLGRWTSCDPAGIKAGIDLYAYVSGNPVRLIDPSGHSGWDSFLGGLKAIGGALEVAAGASLMAAGVATGWTGVGVLLVVAGGLVAAHGIDTVQSGVRTMVTGKPVDTYFSKGLQALGLSRRSANLIDAAVGVVGTLGGAAVAKAPAVAEASIRAGTDAPALVHLSSAEGATAINASETLGRGTGTLYAGPASLSDASTAAKIVRTGLSPSVTTTPVTIPNSALGAFRVPAVVGPGTAWQRAMGTVYSAGAGSLNLTTGAFSRTGVAWNQVLNFYGMDAGMNLFVRTLPTLANWANWGPPTPSTPSGTTSSTASPSTTDTTSNSAGASGATTTPADPLHVSTSITTGPTTTTTAPRITLTGPDFPSGRDELSHQRQVTAPGLTLWW
jgi:RHS repeat-associated protein